MVLESFPGVHYLITVRAVVGEGCWKVLALNMIPHMMAHCMGKVVADGTEEAFLCAVILPYVLHQVFRSQGA